MNEIICDFFSFEKYLRTESLNKRTSKKNNYMIALKKKLLEKLKLS